MGIMYSLWATTEPYLVAKYNKSIDAWVYDSQKMYEALNFTLSIEILKTHFFCI